MSNHNPVKQTRNGSMHTDSARGILNMTNPYVKRVPLKGEAPPGMINLMHQPTYKPPAAMGR
jgi:hypothetical protein